MNQQKGKLHHTNIMVVDNTKGVAGKVEDDGMRDEGVPELGCSSQNARAHIHSRSPNRDLDVIHAKRPYIAYPSFNL